MNAVEIQTTWANAARYHWGMAYVAMTEGRAAIMAEQAKLAEQSELRASPDGKLLAAIFGGSDRPAEGKIAAMGAALPDTEVKAARAAVKADLAKREQASKAARAAQVREPAKASVKADERQQAVLDWLGDRVVEMGELLAAFPAPRVMGMIRERLLVEVRGEKVRANV